jgi:hypothetical protein
LPYTEAVGRLVLHPLRMAASSFPATVADISPDAVAGYALTREGIFDQVPPKVCTIPAAGGLWATPADLVRLGAGWAALLPAALAREAVTPQTPPGPGGYRMGLGWLILPDGETVAHAGTGVGGAASLHHGTRTGRVHVTVTNTPGPIDVIDQPVIRAWTSAVP